MLLILLCELYLYIVGVCYLNESHSDIYAACYSLLEGHYCVDTTVVDLLSFALLIFGEFTLPFSSRESSLWRR